MTSDEILMAQFQNGSREALEELFQRYRRPLFGFFQRRLHNAARAEDLTQEAFLAVIKSKIRYQPRALVRTYLYGICLKLVSSERRWQARAMDRSSFPELVPNASDAEIWVRQALEKLDEIDREVLLLREYDDLSYAEIASLLHVPLNTVRSRLFRARMALKSLLAPESQAGDLCK